jgi:hypothetical protein
MTAFVFGHFGAQRFGRTFDLFSDYMQTGQIFQEPASFFKTDRGSDHPNHADDTRRQRSVQPQGPIPGAESALALRAVIVGSLQRQIAENGLKTLEAAVHITGHMAAGAGVLRPTAGIGGVTVEPLFQGPCGELQGSMAYGGLRCLEIEVFNGVRAQEIFDFFDQADLQRPDERGFF